jgi:hypothetical protein
MSVDPPVINIVKINKTVATSPECIEFDDALEGDLTGVFTVAAMVSPLSTTATGVVNRLYGGKYIIAESAGGVISGHVVAVAATLSGTGFLQVQHLNGNLGENVASSQPIGVALEDGTGAGTPIKVAISGICSVLSSPTSLTFVRGCMLYVDTANAGRAIIASLPTGANRAAIGICLSATGAAVTNTPLLVALKLSYEAT